MPEGPLDDDGHAIGYKVLPRGTRVVTADGTEIGTVVKTIDDAKTHIFDGIVIKTPEGRRFVDAPEVQRIAERRVTLTITAEEAAGLPEFKGFRGVLETHAKRRVNRIKRKLPGR